MAIVQAIDNHLGYSGIVQPAWAANTRIQGSIPFTECASLRKGDLLVTIERLGLTLQICHYLLVILCQLLKRTLRYRAGQAECYE